MNTKYSCLHCGSEIVSINAEGSAYCDIKCENAYAKELCIKLQQFEKQVLKEKKEKINIYLTEAMDECWHEEVASETMGHYGCNKCDNHLYYEDVRDYSTWEGFGKLFSWTQEQGWWKTGRFHNYYSGCILIDVSYSCTGNVKIEKFHLNEYLINPKRFAYAVYNFLSKEEV